MRTDQHEHKHAASMAVRAHRHQLTEVDAAIAALAARTAILEEAMANVVLTISQLPGPVVPPVPDPIDPVTPPVDPPIDPIVPRVRVNVASGQKGVTLTDHGQVVKNLEIVGPGSASYQSGTYGIFSSAALNNVVIRNCVIRGMGNSGMWLGNLTDLLIEDCVIEDVAYAGIMLLGALRATVRRNTVKHVTAAGLPGGNNAYGLVASHVGAQARCTDVLFEDNTVDGVPLWHGLDTHGGLRITFRHNTVRRTPRAVFMTSNDSGAKATDCVVEYNLFANPVQVTGGTNKVAMTTYATVDNRFTGNVIDPAYGAPTVYDYLGDSTGLVESGNVAGTVLP